MDNTCILKIIDVPTDGETGEKTELTTVCSYCGAADDYTVEFDEIFADGMRSHTKLNVKDGRRADLLRSGAISMKTVIEKGSRHDGVYSTPYGDIMIGVQASEFVSRACENSVYLKMNYIIDFGGGTARKKEIILKAERIAETKPEGTKT